MEKSRRRKVLGLLLMLRQVYVDERASSEPIAGRRERVQLGAENAGA
jgi:hypothetical protein